MREEGDVQLGLPLLFGGFAAIQEFRARRIPETVGSDGSFAWSLRCVVLAHLRRSFYFAFEQGPGHNNESRETMITRHEYTG